MSRQKNIVNTTESSRERKWFRGCLLLLATMGSACEASPPCAQPIELSYRVEQQETIDARLFTQGFLIDANGDWWLSGGGYGDSRVQQYSRRPVLSLVQQRTLPANIFAEGLAQRGAEFWLLTWREHTVLRLDGQSLATNGQLGYQGEGWGLSHAAKDDRFLMSNGTATLHWRDPVDFRSLGSVTVKRGEEPVSRLNELEWVDDQLWANIWTTDQLVRIDPNSGCVTAELDLSGLWPRSERPADADVMNGIAYQPEAKWLWVTGKRWGRAFALSLQSGAGD